MPPTITTNHAGIPGRKEGLMALCSTCGRAANAPRIIRLADGAIYEGCVDATHEPHAADVASDYPAWVAQARAAGIDGRP